MRDAPRYLIWPPVSLAAPILLGLAVGAWRPFHTGLSAPMREAAGAILVGSFVLLNGSTYLTMARARTGVLPGQPAEVLLTTGAFRFTRNPLYIGLTLLDIALALWFDSAWALLLLPAGLCALHYGAVLPEERYLAAKFGDAYAEYRRRVRRWV